MEKTENKQKKNGYGGARPGAGRPKSGEPPLKRRQFRASDTDWQRYNDAAEAAGAESTAEWIRQQLGKAATRVLGRKQK